MSRDDGLPSEEATLVTALRAGDEATLTAVVAAWSPGMLRLARWYVHSTEGAEDVVQEAWLAVLQGLPRFEGRSRVHTWVLGIVINVARREGSRERRTLPLPSPLSTFEAGSEPAVSPGRFHPSDDVGAGTWSVPPRRWDLLPEQQLAAAELRGQIENAIGELPAVQRAVITARDVLGLPAAEVAALYGLSDGNQRVLLHRARSRVRSTIEDYVGSAAVDTPEPVRRRGPLERLRGRVRSHAEETVVCAQLVELVTDYLEAALSPGLRARVEEHLDQCGYCRGYVQQVRRLLAETRRLDDVVLDPHLLHDLRTRMRAAAAVVPSAEDGGQVSDSRDGGRASSGW